MASSTLDRDSDDSMKRSSFWLFAIPIGAILLGHYFVDTYSGIAPPLLGVIEQEYGMLPQYAAMLLGLGSICSGLAQPTFAWLSDRLDTRAFGGIGILLGTLGITLLGFSPNIPGVFVIYAIGMLGVGMFHPIAASTIGSLAGDKRGMVLSWFFVFGMGGFFTGSLIGPALATGSGSLRNLSYLLIPGLIMAVVLQLSIGKVQHKKRISSGHTHSIAEYDWWTITCLYLSAVFRFTVNMAIVYLLVRWMEHHVASLNPSWSAEDVADYSAPFVGRANATMIVGQGAGGLAAGALIVAGREKIPLIWAPIVFSPALIALAFLEPGFWGYTACFLTGVGFASMTPVAISVGQRLMPYHTSLASGIVLGGAWAIASTGPRFAEFLIQQFDLRTAFIMIGVVLALSGLSAVGLKQKSLSIRKAKG